ncbi:MAG: NADH-quinone oxidoreductase subunit N [Candidatus Thalassarchaeaceae archaeon]|jgi:NADH-quinone oxidoreductase subunit N|nr:NADH-quinone oxidoreductase subunit N [Candidatus Thalassarchaeaceae archaeon]
MSELEGLSYGLVIPEFLMLAGLIAMILVPNLGDAKMRLPLTSIRIPVLLGGTRFKITSDPRIPNSIAIASFASSLAASAYMLLDGVTGDIGSVMRVDEFSSLMSVIFSSSLLLATIATMHRLPSSPAAKAPSDGDGEEKAAGKIKALYDNRRQVDFHILLLMAGLGMSLMAKSTHLFMLFVCLELASLSSYVLVGFHKESEVGGEAGMKYFIVGSVASAVGIYGMSLLYLWNGDLSISALSSSWDATDPFAVIGVSLMLVAFGFKVGAAPFHLAIPDAYSGAPSSVAGLLATASKAMGFVALMRVLLSVTMPAAGEAFWFTVIAAISVITMTWGNLAALSSDNPKRILAYSSVAHAGYMLAALAALGAGALGTDSSSLVITAVLFHLTILVLFKMGSFLVLTVIETQGGSHRLEGLHGLARRDPVLAASMFVFVLSLAGVPPFSGFLSKLLMINGIVSLTAGSGSLTASFILDWATSVDIAFWLAVAIVVNSALSLFYYLRMGMVMFFEAPEDTGKIPAPTPLRSAIAICAILTVVLGVGPLSEAAIDYVSRAAAAFLP